VPLTHYGFSSRFETQALRPRNLTLSIPVSATRPRPFNLVGAYDKYTETLVGELVSSELDLILVALPIEDPEVETMHLFDDIFVLAAPATRDKRTRTATPTMLAHERLLLLEEGHCLRDQALSFAAWLHPRRARASAQAVSPPSYRWSPMAMASRFCRSWQSRVRCTTAAIAVCCASPCRAQAGDRARLAQDLTPQGGLQRLRGTSQGRGAASSKTLIARAEDRPVALRGSLSSHPTKVTLMAQGEGAAGLAADGDGSSVRRKESRKCSAASLVAWPRGPAEISM
jgi:DNA-binding transcriptional LysR family regulator